MEPKHTRLGIASFALSVLAGSGSFALFAVALVLSRVRGWDHDAREVGKVVGALMAFALVAVNFVALGLGVAGLLQAERKRTFAVLGTVFAVLQIALAFVLVLASR
jgi:hypothetical protein